MITKLPYKYNIEPVIEQVQSLSNFSKRLELNSATGNFFNDPWETKLEFKNTPLGNILDDIGPIGQARLLVLDSGESYTAHCDPDDRIHLAIVTNPYSFLVDISNKSMYHLPADGQLWHMNTGHLHVAANWGPRSRIHLNVRVLLPRYESSRPGLSIKVIKGDYDWKQLAYTPIMQVVNQSIKNKSITGFLGVTDKEILVNTEAPEIFEDAFKKITESGVVLEINHV